MKILLTLLLMSLTFMMSVYANEGIPPVKEGPKVTITIEFGLPIVCTGWGICGWEIHAGSDLQPYVELPGSGGGAGGGGGASWILKIPRTYLLTNEADVLKYFEGQRTISFPDTYVAPPSIKNALGSFKDLIIQKNSTYPMRYENGEYVITIPF